MSNPGSIVILGAGPTGLGAANRLLERGYSDYAVYEANAHPGGLSSSFRDAAGFWWDIGGHVLFSHYNYFDALMDSLIPRDGWVHHVRESWVWVKGRFVPYPFQNNIGSLPDRDMLVCLSGLLAAAGKKEQSKHENFREWILSTFGDGIAEMFMLPYNRKVWAYPPDELSRTWIGERVATPDVERIVDNILGCRPDVSWGPNSTFRFPLNGGTGSIWAALADRLPPEKLRMQRRAVALSLKDKAVRFDTGETAHYDMLVSSIPLDVLTGICTDMDADIALGLSRLKRSSVHVIGVGFKGAVPDVLRTKCWMYFPEDNCPFYRVTVFSNYSPNNVPKPGEYWSLMAEVSESQAKPVDAGFVVKDVIRGMKAVGLVAEDAEPETVWHHRSEYGNPVPSIERDEVLDPAFEYLESKDVYQRGRFGAWKYEVSNMDHSVMQGVELVDRLLSGGKETTLCHPSEINR